MRNVEDTTFAGLVARTSLDALIEIIFRGDRAILKSNYCLYLFH